MGNTLRPLALAFAVLTATSAVAAGADTIVTAGTAPSPLPLPVAKVTVPSLVPIRLTDGTKMSVLDQVHQLEGVNGMPVMFVVTPKEAADEPMPWSLITSIHVRMFSINASTYPEVAEYLTHQRILTQNAYALEIPPKGAGQQPTIVLWKNEVNGALTQDKLEQIYAAEKIRVDPITAPPLNETSWNNLLINAANKEPEAPTRLIILAFHASDPDVKTLTQERILAGVEFVKSNTAPVVELDEDAHPDIAAKLIASTASNNPLLIVFNLADRRIEGVYDPPKLSSLTEDGFQTFAMQHGVTSFLNTRTDVAEAFLRVIDQMHKAQQAAANSPATNRDAGHTPVKEP